MWVVAATFMHFLPRLFFDCCSLLYAANTLTTPFLGFRNTKRRQKINATSAAAAAAAQLYWRRWRWGAAAVVYISCVSCLAVLYGTRDIFQQYLFIYGLRTSLPGMPLECFFWRIFQAMFSIFCFVLTVQQQSCCTPYAANVLSTTTEQRCSSFRNTLLDGR